MFYFNSLCLSFSVSFLCEVITSSKLYKMIKVQSAMCSVNGDEWGMTKLEEPNWTRCQNMMPYLILNVCFLRRLATHGKHGSKNKIFGSNLANSFHWILYCLFFHFFILFLKDILLILVISLINFFELVGLWC